MRQFTITLTVTNCGNCPFADTDGRENQICTESEGDWIEGRNLRRQNAEQITDSCPYFNETTEA